MALDLFLSAYFVLDNLALLVASLLRSPLFSRRKPLVLSGF